MAVQFAGITSCLIDPLAQPKSLGYYVDETKCKMLFTHVGTELLPNGMSALTRVIKSGELDNVIYNNDAEQFTGMPVEWNNDDICYIYYTSGTTSQPKGVMLTPGNHQNFFKICRKYWQPVNENSRHLCFVPFSHGFGSVFLIPLALNTGAQLYILRSFHPVKVMDAIDKFDISHMYGVPSHYLQLLRSQGCEKILPKLKMAFCAAAKLDEQVMLQWKEIAGFNLDEGYGLIETTGGVIWRVGDKPRCTGHVGVCPESSLIEVGIMDEDHNLLGNGEIGEIVVRGKSVMKGYLNKPEENERVFVDEWFKTGDQGYISDDQNLFMTGRVKDIINIAGIKISPYEVEEVLNKHDAVVQAVVVAADDALYGEVVKAFVKREPQAKVSERDLIRYASEHLINFQVPKQIVFLDTFPVNNMGKLDRKKLRVFQH
jgi:long-chain acyl-CoA synthetase